MTLARSHRLICALAVGFFMFLSAGATVQSQRASRLVEEVDVMGNRRLTAKEILSHLKTKPGNLYSPGRVQRDLQALLDLGRFDKRGTRVSTETGVRGGVVVIFEVKELPSILGVTFAGLGGIPEPEVMDALRRERINLTSDEVFDVAQMNRARLVIQRFLARRGRPNVAVDLLTENVTSMSVRLTFVITNEARFD
jgi:outer membrane protein assembly factor BamA